MTIDVNGTRLRISATNDTKAALDDTIYIKPNMKSALYFNGDTETFITRSNMERFEAYGMGVLP